MERSRWGWGYAGQLDALKGSVKRAGQFFGKLDEQAAVADDAIRLPPARVPVPAALQDMADTRSLTRARFTYGKSYCDRIRGFYGDYASAPDFVLSPRNEADVQRAVDVCSHELLALTPFGGGSSVTGGVETTPGNKHRGAVALDLSRLDQVLEVDKTSLTARIQAGTFGPHLESQLASHGLTLRHFPQSFEFSTLGGWVVTRAGGHFATLYTHIDELVQSVRMVTPAGILETPHLPASGAGPDSNRLVCGSEGTLGVVTEATLRVRPRPFYRGNASIHFKDYDKAVAATRTLAQSGLYPANCRLLDSKEAFLNQVTDDGSHVLVVAFESADHPVQPWLERALAITRDFGGDCPKGASWREGDGHAEGADAGEQWRQSFLAGPYLQDAMIQAGILADTFETACTWQAFPALYEGVNQAVTKALADVCGMGLVTCRFTHVYPDGPAPYFTFLGKARRGAELEQWQVIKQAAGDALRQFGGTITHHHAVGRMHKPWYQDECPPLFMAGLKAVKATLDPQGILNPGVLFD